jgi:hypothetical protein
MADIAGLGFVPFVCSKLDGSVGRRKQKAESRKQKAESRKQKANRSGLPGPDGCWVSINPVNQQMMWMWWSTSNKVN